MLILSLCIIIRCCIIFFAENIISYRKHAKVREHVNIVGGGCLNLTERCNSMAVGSKHIPKAHKTCCLCEHVWLNLSGYHFSFCQWKMKSVSQSCKGYVFVFVLGLSQTDKREVTAWAGRGAR